MRIGLDFGTTNSGAAAFDGQQVHVFPLDPDSRDPGVIRSVLYITREQEITIGQEAIDTYYRQNVGRASRMVRRYVGEVEVVASEMFFVRDVYVLVDELTPGRMLRSLKSALSGDYEGTTIFERYYSLEELIAIYLRALRERVEAETGEPVDSVVLGRPVTFVGSEEGAGNQRAEDRLRRAAEMAGFREVAFELEPVAAALHYELSAEEPQNVVVFDFGGGTLDITVMRVGGDLAERHIFATAGVGIAGDAFDQRIIERLLLDHFGRGTTLRSGEGAGELPFPDKYTDPLVHWQTIPELNRPDALRFLELAQVTGSHPARVRALESLLVNNYAIRMIDEVERAKIALSSAHFATIQLAGGDVNLWQPITRSQFEALIVDAVKRIEACLLDTVECSGLGVDEIDVVVRTGGSAQIPCFIEMVERIFGARKVVLSSVFSGVTSGLAIRAWNRE
ncbi:MAG: Hsp70 family protein [Anaerolineae bacterium]|nr:Hsp70 family protein [Anaerolineae bacterium]